MKNNENLAGVEREREREGTFRQKKEKSRKCAKLV